MPCRLISRTRRNPALVEVQPLLRIVFRELLRLDGKAKRGQGPQEDAVQAQLQIFVDDIIDAIEAGFRRGHQGPDPVGTQNFLGSPNPATASSWLFPPGLGRFLLCRSAGPSSEVESRMLFALAELENCVVQQRQIGRR